MRFVIFVAFVHRIFLGVRHGNGVNANPRTHSVLTSARYVYLVTFPDARIAVEDIAAAKFYIIKQSLSYLNRQLTSRTAGTLQEVPAISLRFHSQRGRSDLQITFE